MFGARRWTLGAREKECFEGNTFCPARTSTPALRALNARGPAVVIELPRNSRSASARPDLAANPNSPLSQGLARQAGPTNRSRKQQRTEAPRVAATPLPGLSRFRLFAILTCPRFVGCVQRSVTHRLRSRSDSQLD